MLSIDRAAAAASPSTEDVSVLANHVRVFVSSVMGGMADERQAAAEGIRGVGATPVMFEAFGGRDADPEHAYLAEVASSDIYLGILGRRYGRLLPSRRSATHEEYREAERLSLRISVWTSGAEDWTGDQQDLINEVRLFHVTGSHRNPADLKRGIHDRLRELAAEDLSPWVKLGKALDDGLIFRAREIHDDGRRMTVVAAVEDAAVLAGLEALRGTAFGRWRGTATVGDTSRQVLVREVLVTRRTGMTTDVTIELDRDDSAASPSEPLPQMAYRLASGQYGAADITEQALRSTLFGERHPFGSMGFLAKIAAPIAVVRDLRLSEEVLRPIVRLLITEVLVGSGRATRLNSVRLGPPIRGQRRLELSWTPPGRDATAEPRTVTGDIHF